MPLAQLLPDIPQARDVVISGLVMDSREVQPGDAFVAVAGFGAHGLCFIEDACARGAVAILFEPPAPQGVSVPDGAIAVHGLRARLGAMADR
ncbi:MAG TPA: Mur ligase domain-containing protein, partial [Xylella fastidiosa subsp. multiplex]